MMKLSRRRFLGHVLGAGLVGAASYGTYRGFVPAIPNIQVDYPGMALGHALRDASLNIPSNLPTRKIGLLIAGSGAAALSAAWQLSKHGIQDYVLLDGPERNGNNRGATFQDISYPTGAHYLPLPSEESSHIHELLSDLGLLQNGHYDERALVHAPSERLYYQQQWQTDILPDNDDDSRRFFRHMADLSRQRGNDGQRVFSIPIIASSQDQQWQQLDGITFATWLQQQQYRSPTLLWYADYCCRDDYGQGIHQVSAWAGLHYFCARQHNPNTHTVLTWPDGLNTLSERIRALCQLRNINSLAAYRTLQQSGCALAASAIHIEERANDVKVLVRDHSGALMCLHADAVVCAMPLYIAAKVVHNIGQYGFEPSRHMPSYAPWLVSNFILQNLPPEAAGTPLAWDNVAYQGQGLGYVWSGQQDIRHGPPSYTSFTAYNALNFAAPDAVRSWLASSDPNTLYHHAAAEIEDIYGLSLRRHIIEARITVRGHAMAVPTPNYRHNPGLQALQNHRGRLLFAHSDLSGYSIFEEACWWGKQAGLALLPP